MTDTQILNNLNINAYLTKSDLLNCLEHTNDAHVTVRIILYAIYDSSENLEWVQNLCLEYSNHSDFDVAYVAIHGLGDLLEWREN